MKLPFHLTWIAGLLWLLAACTPGLTPTADTANPTPAPVRVALLPITDVVPFYVAQAEGYFEEAGVEAVAVPVSSAAERGAVVQAAGADCELTDIHGVLLTNAASATPMQIIATARAATATQALFFLLAAPARAWTDAAALEGANIAISENTIIDYWNDRILAAVGIDPARITRTNVPQLPVRLELLMNNQVDAAILPDPLAALAQLQGATLLADDTLRPEIGASVLACRQDFIAANPDTVRGLLESWQQAVAAINADPDAFRNVLIEQTRVPDPLQDRYQLPPFPSAQVPSAAQVADVADWLLEKGLLAAAPIYEDVVDPSFLP